jgi:hypothetical protein
MHANLEAMRAARLALLDAALSALLRDAIAQELDGIEVRASLDQGQTVIDLMFMKGGMPVTGFDL